MQITYWITWQCADNDSGQYFLTKIPSAHLDLAEDQLIEELMEIAFAIEEIDLEPAYEIASILRVSGGLEVEVEVVY